VTTNQDAGGRRLISYLLPVYNEEESVAVFFAALTQAVEPLTGRYDFEFLFVNDGSADGSQAILESLASADPRVRVITFSRNFGHQIALTAAFDHARGDAVIAMDTDLQDPPAVSLELIERWEQGFEVVYAQRRSRRDSWFKRTTANLFYRLLDHLAEIKIPRNVGDFRLLDRQVLEALKRMPEHNRYIRGMVSWVGFRQTAVEFDRDARYAGTTGYPLRKMIRFAVNGIVGFSAVPLKLIAYVGCVATALSAIAVGYILVVRLFFADQAVPGWAFTAVAIFFVGGVQMLMLSVLGTYLSRVYTEAQNRPLYIVRSVVGGGAGGPVQPPVGGAGDSATG
jgi:dolichol-phosphate mannosyltransferase